MMKLSDGDLVINVDYSDNKDVFVATKNGYGLWYPVDSVSIVGIRAGGVKSIKLKDDEVVASTLFDPNCEYITIVTDKGTAKRLRLTEIEKSSRANKGILLMKEIKSNPSKILACYLVPSKESIMVRSIAEEKIVKLTEISIMDRQSNGSFIVKDRIVDSSLVPSLITDNVEPVLKETHENRLVSEDKEYKSLKNIDDKMRTIELQLDDIEEK